MARKITKIAAAIVTLATLHGLASAALAEQKRKPIVKLPPKTCLWVQTGQVVASGSTTKDTADGTVWKCTGGSWSQVPAPRRSKGGAK